MTDFYVHFGSDGGNTVIHASARKHWESKPGVLVQISEDDKQVIIDNHPQDLVFTGGRIEAMGEKDRARMSAILPPPSTSKMRVWVERFLLVAAGAAAMGIALNF